LRRLLGVAALALACTACGGTKAAKPQEVPGEPGFRVQVEGQRMYYECAGRGSPTVVLEAGLASDHSAWSAVAPALAHTTRTCSYDRAGLGFSAPVSAHRTGRDQVKELHELLAAAGEGPPYVIVGHSYGGLLAREFAATYRDDVAGVVLVDSSHPAMVQRFLAALGPPRPGESPIRRRLRTFLRQEPRNTEGLDLRASLAEARRAGPIGDKPLVVITAGLENDPSLPPALKRLLDRTWLSLQNDLARSSANSSHVIAVHSRHDVIAFTGQPDLVAEAIGAVVHAARAKRPLPSCREIFRGPGARCVSG
jgi:pimeloyl-ACP methyl ester carboxylesterase